MIATGSGHREIAQLLVDGGADVNTQNKVGELCFFYLSVTRKGCVYIRFLGSQRLHLFPHRKGRQHSCLLVCLATVRLHSCW